MKIFTKPKEYKDLIRNWNISAYIYYEMRWMYSCNWRVDEVFVKSKPEITVVPIGKIVTASFSGKFTVEGGAEDFSRTLKW